MRLPIEFAAPIFVFLSILFGKRGWDAIRDGYVGWGTNDSPIFINRSTNPGAFWFFVSLFWLFCLGFTYGAFDFTVAILSRA